MANPFQVTPPNVLQALLMGQQGFDSGRKSMQDAAMSEAGRLYAAGDIKGAQAAASRGGSLQALMGFANLQNNDRDAVQGVSRLAGAVRNAVSPEANVAADLGRAFVRDETAPGWALQQLSDIRQHRPNATLADVAGENVKGIVERVSQTPGGGRTITVPNLTQRQQGQAMRISQDLKELTGAPKSAFETINETMAERAKKARPLYDEAMAVDIAQNQQVVDAIMGETATGWGRAILNSTNVKRTLQTEYGVTETPGPQHLMPIIDAWKKAADDMVESATRTGDKNKARVISQMSDRVISVVDEANPAYKAARDAWAGPSRYMDAVERGRGILKEPAEEFAARFRALPDAEKEAERIGAVSAIVARMGSDGAKLGDMTKYLRSPEMRGKISALMPSQEAAASWARRLEYEVNSSEMTGRALGNSATARRLAEKQDAENLAADLVMDAMTGSPQSFVKKVLGAGPKWLRDTMRSRADALLADTLTNPSAAADLPRILQRAQNIGAPVSDRVNAAAAVGGTELLAP